MPGNSQMPSAFDQNHAARAGGRGTAPSQTAGCAASEQEIEQAGQRKRDWAAPMLSRSTRATRGRGMPLQASPHECSQGRTPTQHREPISRHARHAAGLRHVHLQTRAGGATARNSGYRCLDQVRVWPYMAAGDAGRGAEQRRHGRHPQQRTGEGATSNTTAGGQDRDPTGTACADVRLRGPGNVEFPHSAAMPLKPCADRTGARPAPEQRGRWTRARRLHAGGLRCACRAGSGEARADRGGRAAAAARGTTASAKVHQRQHRGTRPGNTVVRGQEHALRKSGTLGDEGSRAPPSRRARAGLSNAQSKLAGGNGSAAVTREGMPGYACQETRVVDAAGGDAVLRGCTPQVVEASWSRRWSRPERGCVVPPPRPRPGSAVHRRSMPSTHGR